MVASHKTIEHIVNVFTEHLGTQDAVIKLVDDLYDQVDGNISVRETLAALYKYVHGVGVQ